VGRAGLVIGSPRGYVFIYYEENLKNNQLFIIRFDTGFQPGTQQQLLEGTHVWDFEFSQDGKWLAFSSSEKNLIDHRYMFRKIQILDMSTGKVVKEAGNVGKLGNYVFNPDGSQLAFTSALNINDHAVSQVFTYSLKDETIRNHTPSNFKGHIRVKRPPSFMAELLIPGFILHKVWNCTVG